MSLHNWFNQLKEQKNLRFCSLAQCSVDKLWYRCKHCKALMYKKYVQDNANVCLECGYHYQICSKERIRHLIDFDTWIPINEQLYSVDPIEFYDRLSYSQRLQNYQQKTGLIDAVSTGFGLLNGLIVALGVMDFSFMGGSMGSVVGEKLTRLIEKATNDKRPLIIVCASGGARMQEGMLSLMQMAKVSGALQLHRESGLLYISVITNPTMGGVTASFAMLGDIILSEPKATIGFAGKRVIEKTIRENLPDNFQTAEDLLSHGFIDLIVPREKLKHILENLLAFHQDNVNDLVSYTKSIPLIDKSEKENIIK